MCLTGQVSPLSLSAPCALRYLLKLHTLLKRTLIPGREGDGKLGQLNLFLSIRSRLLNWNPLTSWGPWPLKFLAKFCLRICAFLSGEGPYLSIRFSKGSVDSEVKHYGTRWCCFFWILVYFTSRSDKFKMQREVGGWEILSKQLQEPFLIWGGYILDIFGTWSSLQKLCCLFLREIQEARNRGEEME